MTINLASMDEINQTSDSEVAPFTAWTTASKSMQSSEVNSFTAVITLLQTPGFGSTDQWDSESVIELIETIEDLQDEELIQAVAEARQQIREGDVLTYEELLEELGFTEEELSDES
jgi:hypothetical protein